MQSSQRCCRLIGANGRLYGDEKRSAMGGGVGGVTGEGVVGGHACGTHRGHRGWYTIGGVGACGGGGCV